MALIKYVGQNPVTVMLNGERMLIKPNKVFNGPEHFNNYDDFIVLGLSKVEKKNKGVHKGISLEIKTDYEPFFDINFILEEGYPKVSICIVTKDGYDKIKRCLESIDQFVQYKNKEILICDTGTTDQKVFDLYNEYFQKWGESLKVSAGHIYNFSKNNNFLAQQSTGSMVLFLNNDVFFTYDAVAEMVKYALCSNIGCVGHRLVWDEKQTEIQHDGQILFDMSNGRWIGPGHHNYHKDINQIDNKNTRVEGVTAACLLMRKSVFQKVGGFDELYKDIYQDVDLNLKVRKLGYDNFCIREKALIHVDHGTRKGDGTQDSPDDFRKFYADWIATGPFPIRSKKRYSILVCATKLNDLKKLRSSIKSKDEYEFIFYNNSNNYLWSSEALNILTEVSEGEILIWMHQDVTFDAPEPFAVIDQQISSIGGSFGILGPAGIQVGSQGAIRGVDFSSSKYNFNHMRVQTLDEFCLIGQRKNNLKFGEYLDHFHFYGADICLTALEKGLSNFVIAIPITHHSGGDVNLKKGKGFEYYRQQGKKLFKKWGKKHPHISTTTMHFRNDQVYWFLGDILGLTPSREVIDVDNINEEDNIKNYKL